MSNDYVSKIIKVFESGNKGSRSIAHCGNDWGMSYGTYALTLRWGNSISFLKKYFPVQSSALYFNNKADITTPSYPGASYCSSPADVTKVWLDCITKFGEDVFFECEHDYINTNFYMPFANKIKSSLMFDIDGTYSNRALQECIWSWAVNKGWLSAFNSLCSILKDKNMSMSDFRTNKKEELFDAIYDYRYSVNAYDRYKKGLMSGSSEREVLRKYLNIKPCAIEEGGKTMGLTINKDYICRNTDNMEIRGFLGNIRKIVVHYTGNPDSTAKNNCIHYRDDYEKASANYYVDFNGDIYQSVEEENIAWHCGVSKDLQARGYHSIDDINNGNTIGIEMCCHKVNTKTESAYDKDWYFDEATIKSTVNLVVSLLKKYNLTANDVIRHYDCNTVYKPCPRPFQGTDTNTYYKKTGETLWSLFKENVKRVYNGGSYVPIKSSTNTPSTVTPTSTTYPYVAKVNASDGLNVRSSANSSVKTNILATLSKSHWVVVLKSASNGWVYVQTVKSGKLIKGYVYSKYITKYDTSKLPIRTVTDATGLNIRTGKGNTYPVIATMGKGFNFIAIGTGTSWGLIQCGETLGFSVLSDKYSKKIN